MSGLAADPGRIRDLARALREGSLTSEALVRRCLDRIAAVEDGGTRRENPLCAAKVGKQFS